MCKEKFYFEILNRKLTLCPFNLCNKFLSSFKNGDHIKISPNTVPAKIMASLKEHSTILQLYLRILIKKIIFKNYSVY